MDKNCCKQSYSQADHQTDDDLFLIYRVISSNGKNNFGDYDDYSYSQDYDDPFENNENGGNDWLFGGE